MSPISPHDGSLADSTSGKTWGTFDHALEACQRDNSLAGVGFVFTADDPYCGVDLDNSIDADGNLKPWAIDLLAKLDSYSEISPSACGLKVFIKPNKPGKRCRKAYHDGVEATVSSGSAAMLNVQLTVATNICNIEFFFI